VSYIKDDNSIISYIVCGLKSELNDAGQREWICPYCNWRSQDIDDFATTQCWQCLFGGDPGEPELAEEYDDDPTEDDFIPDEPPGWWE
jgi:ferredoxin-thioredoxin reductase catalytic subunit